MNFSDDRNSILFNSKSGILLITSDREKEKYLSEGFQHIQDLASDEKISYKIFFCKFHKRYEFVFYEYIDRKSPREELILKIIEMIEDCRFLGLDPNDSPVGLKLLTDGLSCSYIQLNPTIQKRILTFIKKLIELNEKTIIYFFLNSNNIYTDVFDFVSKNNIETIKNLTNDDLKFLKDEIKTILYLNVVGLRKEIDKIKNKKLVRIHHILLYLLNIKRALEETNDNDVLETLKQVEELIRDNYDLLIKYFRVFAKEYFYEKSREMFLKDMFNTLYNLTGDGRFLKPLIYGG
jgi:hypothetical protein